MVTSRPPSVPNPARTRRTTHRQAPGEVPAAGRAGSSDPDRVRQARQLDLVARRAGTARRRALFRAEYLDGLAAAGFTDASVTFTHEAAPGMHSAIIRAIKPATA